jgi:hypothetical protein
MTLMGYAALLSWLFAPAVVVAAGFMGSYWVCCMWMDEVCVLLCIEVNQTMPRRKR